MIKCCLCGKECEGEGHRVEPVGNDETDRCCDKCHKDIVEPMRALDTVNRILRKSYT